MIDHDGGAPDGDALGSDTPDGDTPNGNAPNGIASATLADLLSDPLPSSHPAHIAIIMDGNGRWAKARGLPRKAGHRRGIKAAHKVVSAASEIGIRYLTMFGFSCENWRRPAVEVGDLMQLLRFYLRSESEQFHQRKIRLRVIGDRLALDSDIIDLIEQIEALTCDNHGLTLVLALNYGSQQELVAATRKIAASCRAGHIASEDIDEHLISCHLFTDGIPSPDLIIRTSGEQRLSNFLLWQSAYAELLFTDTLWPDFTEWHLREAIREFQRRERRFGSTAEDRKDVQQQDL